MLISNWIIIAFIGTIITAFGAIGMKFISNSKYDNKVFILFSFILAGLLSALYLIFDRESYYNFINNCEISFVIYTLLFAIIVLSANLIKLYAFSISPNIAYTHIIVNINIVFTLIASILLFNQKINIESFIGIVITFIGITIIALYSDKS